MEISYVPSSTDEISQQLRKQREQHDESIVFLCAELFAQLEFNAILGFGFGISALKIWHNTCAWYCGDNGVRIPEFQ
jgi:hypothetical protein